MIAPIDTTKRFVNSLAETVVTGLSHRRRLDRIDTRIVVSGIRGKSTVTRWLHDIFHDRGYDTYAKVTGTVPISIHNGQVHDIDRDDQVRLYENERELRRFAPVDVAIFENQGIRQYTTRLINQQFVKPDVVFLTNIREDHLDTLGSDRFTIAREFARTIPKGTHVVSGEQDPEIRRYLAREIERHGGSVSHVEVPGEYERIPGQECIYGIDDVLRAVGETSVSEARIAEYLTAFDVSWTRLPGGRLYDASDANDVQSTELIRRSLDPDATIEPIIFLRADRRGRTASFLQYLTRIYEKEVFERVHATGGGRTIFNRRASFHVETYDPETTDPETVLDNALSTGNAAFIMGNTVDEFIDALQAEIEHRSEQHAASTGELAECRR